MTTGQNNVKLVRYKVENKGQGRGGRKMRKERGTTDREREREEKHRQLKLRLKIVKSLESKNNLHRKKNKNIDSLYR